jgi:hypothetical protein
MCVWFNNHLVFEWSSVTDFRHLIFFPAGLKLILLMSLGWRAVPGIAVGSAGHAAADLPDLPMLHLAALCLVYAAAPMAAVSAFGRWAGIVRPWFGLRLVQLLCLVVVTAVVTSIAFNTLLIAWGIMESAGCVGSVVAMAGGDVVGAALLLAVTLMVRRWISQSPR